MLIYADFTKLKNLLERVTSSEHSAFYREKYGEKITSVTKPAHHPDGLNNEEFIHYFENLPYLTRQDITSTHPDKRLFIDRSEIEFISYTSGTTDGKPLILYWSHVDDYFFNPSLGLDVQTLLILHPALNKNFGHTFIQQCRQAKKPLTPVFADYQNLAQSAIIAGATQIDTIYTTPTLAEHIADHLDTHYDTARVKLLVLFSETLTPTKRSVLEKRYPNAEIANVYASSEVGQILFFPSIDDIRKKNDHMQIIKDAIIAVELVEGELILTMEQNKAFPLIRYKTGDFFELVQDSNQNKISTSNQNLLQSDAEPIILKWAGRIDVDKIKVNGLEIRAEDIEQALSTCVNEIGSVYQFHFYSTESPSTHKETIKIEIEVQKKYASAFAQKEAEEKIIQALLTKWFFTTNATLQTAIDKGLALMPTVRFVESLSLQTQKTRRVVSHI